MVTTKDMVEAYLDCRKSKRRKDSSTKFELNFEDNCYDLAEEINNRTYEIGDSIVFFVTEPKKREVFAADFRDRVVHHWLALRLEPLFEKLFIEDTYNCRKEKGTQYGIQRLYDKIKVISNNYTRDCWVAKFDIQGFFMSIYKPTLWEKLEEFIFMNYKNPQDFNDVLWVAKKIVMHCPEKKCIKKSPSSAWVGFPKNKSLFTCGEGYGLPIGNLPSQQFVNFYLDDFDKWMVSMFGSGYGRYVDDFFVIDTNKKKILHAIPVIKDYLMKTLQIRLHPKKIYIQHYTKGIKFIGGVVKPHRKYSSNRTVDKFIKLIDYLNEHPHTFTTEEAVCRVNSYLGFLRHTASYSIRRKAIQSLNDGWWKRTYVKGHYEVLVAKMKKKYRYNITESIKSGLIY